MSFLILFFLIVDHLYRLTDFRLIQIFNQSTINDIQIIQCSMIAESSQNLLKIKKAKLDQLSDFEIRNANCINKTFRKTTLSLQAVDLP